MRFQSYLNTAVSLITNYYGNIPLVHYLKNYFAQNKKHGSKDRKAITHLCYCYFRLGKSLNEVTFEEKIKIALYLCHNKINEYGILYNNNWLANWHSSLAQRIDFVQKNYPNFSIHSIFVFTDLLSEGICKEEFVLSFFNQPQLFLRVRPNYLQTVLQKLQAAAIAYKLLNNNCIALPNTTKVDAILQVNKDVVIQDYSSQQIAQYYEIVLSALNVNNYSTHKPLLVWDCCAASGGKSILLLDTFPNIKLTVSDIRESILINLAKRFKEAGINNYQSFVTDLSKEQQDIKFNKYQFIVCDVPCSGSGTWGRTPEQIQFFTNEKLNNYTLLQQKITLQAAKHLNKNGFFLYITCSVFTTENEDIVKFLLANTALQLVQMQNIVGYNNNADTMFVALFKNV
ncbi:MAG TPA: Fmu (Sun) domain-containing protein [Chitinophagaceae bacterium]|nr:Fmu (Sun) domain-containing protein [Chitinophagaceae bacterium]MCC6634883.1 Fmu (Sun) domain-containing protein [Chitinophagaceae bacterium]HNF28708.1 Fmu (Sun) domain-containing protein [Chitinophagaceae bacterium]HNL83272.1 Fmu (Sun) domain-containing protein [Chitinophagaceae bacterium]HNM34339.1 Fmu (Sun) domain-containing protein [Chitinophagaceae bacterium]